MVLSERVRAEQATAEVYDLPLPPDAPGQRVRAVSAGGQVAAWMETGVVVRFTRAGNPVVRVDAPGRVGGFVEVTDREVCFRRVDDGGRWVRPRTRLTPAGEGGGQGGGVGAG